MDDKSELPEVPMSDASATNPSNNTQNQPEVVLSRPPPMVFSASEEADDLQKKRVAMAGQWRTPPTPFFPALPVETTPVIPDVPAQLPHSTEDYAKALQEAYRQGAEAAARAAAQQLAQVTVLPTPMETSLSLPPPPTTMSMPPPPVSTTEASGAVQVVHHHHHHHILPAPETEVVSAAAKPIAPLPAASSSNPPPSQSTAQQQQRSVSLPDMSSYAAQQEEEKRQKRLARNRASARLRRLRKKNLVDAYEVEVGALEKTLSALQQHDWGAARPTALAEALAMDRGQQKLTVAERHAAATEILQQQLQFIEQLEELMKEQFVLQQVAQVTLTNVPDHEWKDLQETLQLSTEQCQQIMDQATGWQEEWNALQTVKTSLQAMKENNWLWNEDCSTIADQFLSILHSNQISKFLLWADHNSEAIEELDGVHAIPVVAEAPVFQFGMDHNPNGGGGELMDEEKGAA